MSDWGKSADKTAVSPSSSITAFVDHASTIDARISQSTNASTRQQRLRPRGPQDVMNICVDGASRAGDDSGQANRPTAELTGRFEWRARMPLIGSRPASASRAVSLDLA